MRNKILILLIVFILPNFVYSQIVYTAKPIMAYFSFFKNGKSQHILNDSIKTSFKKISRKKFVIKFYFKNEFKGKCKCIFSGIEKIDTARYFSSDGVKEETVERLRIVRELQFKDPSCINLLPKEVLFRKE